MLLAALVLVVLSLVSVLTTTVHTTRRVGRTTQTLERVGTDLRAAVHGARRAAAGAANVERRTSPEVVR